MSYSDFALLGAASLLLGMAVVGVAAIVVELYLWRKPMKAFFLKLLALFQEVKAEALKPAPKAKKKKARGK